MLRGLAGGHCVLHTGCPHIHTLYRQKVEATVVGLPFNNIHLWPAPQLKQVTDGLVGYNIKTNRSLLE